MTEDDEVVDRTGVPPNGWTLVRSGAGRLFRSGAGPHWARTRGPHPARGLANLLALAPAPCTYSGSARSANHTNDAPMAHNSHQPNYTSSLVYGRC